MISACRVRDGLTEASSASLRVAINGPHRRSETRKRAEHGEENIERPNAAIGARKRWANALVPVKSRQSDVLTEGMHVKDAGEGTAIGLKKDWVLQSDHRVSTC